MLAKPGQHHAAHEVRGPGVRADEGGRRPAHPVLPGYRPQFYFRTTDVTGRVLKLLGEAASPPRCACPATTSGWKSRSSTPIAMEEGLRFAIREGGRTVGAGVVTKVIA